MIKNICKYVLCLLGVLVLTVTGQLVTVIAILLDYLVMYAESLEDYLDDKVTELGLWSLED